MAPDDTRRGPSGDGMKYIHDLGFRELRSLTASVTVSCVHHRAHEAKVSGPYRWVLDLMGTFRELAVSQGRWVIVEYEPSEEDLPMAVSDWI